jgi:hypothetical protein
MQDGVGSATAALQYSSRDPNRYRGNRRARAGRHSGRSEGAGLRPTNRTGLQIKFRERGRDFYAFIDFSNRAVATEAVAILNTLRVSPR